MRNPFSNAPTDRYPDTSASGYPLFYPLDGNGNPAGPARLVYANQTFADEAELETFKLRSVQRDANLERWRHEWETWQWWGPVPVESIDIDDARYLRYQMDSGAGHGVNLWYAALSGGNLAINRWIGASFPLPADYDPATYNGPLRGLIDGL